MTEFGGHDLIWLENRRTPKVVSRGAKYEPKPSEGKIVRRREANADEEKTISSGGWVRVNERGEKPGSGGYMRKKSKVRPQHNSVEDSVAASIVFSNFWSHFLAMRAGYEGVTHAGLAIVAADTGRVLLAQRAADPTDDPEVAESWEFPGGSMEDGEDPMAAAVREFEEEVGWPVPDGEVTDGWRAGTEQNYQGFVYVTPEEFSTDGWEPTGEVQALTWVEPAEITSSDTLKIRPELANFDTSLLTAATKEDTMPEDEMDDVTVPDGVEVEDDDEPDFSGEPTGGPENARWHGVLTVEGKPSGDRRRFKAGGITTRPLPLPLTWQKVSNDGHKGSVTVAVIERLELVGDEWRADGRWLYTPEADEVATMIAEFGRFGVSVDADAATHEYNEDEEMVEFTSARIASAAIVPIPAFAEAWVSLGSAPDDFFQNPETADEALVASAFADLAPGKTEDGPGWLTHPVDTDRLRDYWTRGEGAAKIAWGTPGDFNRCRVNLAKYVKPQYLAGYCANRHYDALGIWPGQHHSLAEAATQADLERLAAHDREGALALVAAAGHVHDIEMFTNPGFAPDDGRMVKQPNGSWACPMTITPEGRVFGHIASWRTCHTGFADRCVVAPKSATNYAYFLLGQIDTTNGSLPVGTLSIGGGHAPGGASLRAAIEHYDSTSTAFAYVNVGEDEYGIWFSGVLAPGVDENMLMAAKAAKLSGDWRNAGGGRMEMVAALAVNSPGFPIVRIAASYDAGREVSLVAAGYVEETLQSAGPAPEIDVAALVAAVCDEYEVRRQRRDAMNRLAVQRARAEMAAIAARRKEDS